MLIVAGLGRCGSSLTMQMLDAGGVPVVGRFPAYEPPEAHFASVRMHWLAQQEGRAVKVLDPELVREPFSSVPRIVIWLGRDLTQQSRSIAKFSAMLMGLPWKASQVRRLAAALKRDYPLARKALGLPDVVHLDMSFEELISQPLAAAARMAEFLKPHGFTLDERGAAAVVRVRGTACLDGLLEAELLKDRRAVDCNG